MSFRRLLLASSLTAALLATAPLTAQADEGGERVRLSRSSDADGDAERLHGPSRHGRHEGHQSRGGHETVVVRRHAHHHEDCRYEAGHHEVRVREVVIPGYWRERHVPAEYEVVWSRSRCAYVRVLVRRARTIRRWVPRRVETRRTRVWVPGRWVCVDHGPRHHRGRGHGHHDHDDHVRGRVHVRGKRGSIDIVVRR